VPETTSPVSKYIAFISYRHTDNEEEDRQWATWLHQQLETYDIPAELIGKTNQRGEIIPERIYPVFRDEVSLPADADLGKAIIRALDASRFLVVLCSPRAVQSRYLKEEVTHFKATGKSDRVIAALILGEPNASTDPAKPEDPEDVRTLECFPEPLRYEVDSNGVLLLDKPAESLAADFRLLDDGKGLTNPSVYRQQLLESGVRRAKAETMAVSYEEKINTAKLKIIAGILGVQLDVLIKRDRLHQLKLSQRKARRARGLVMLMSGLFLAALLGAYFAWNQYQKAETARSQSETLLSRVRLNLNFMNFELRDVLDSYVPTEPRIRIMQSIDAIVEDIEQFGGSSADISASATAWSQKAELILRSTTQNTEDALPLMQKAHEAYSAMVELDPSNSDFQRDLSVSYTKLGDFELRLGNTDAALQHYNNALTIALTPVLRDPSNSGFQRDLSISYEKLGDIELRLGNSDAALQHYNNVLTVMLKLVELDPSNSGFQRDLSISYSKLGDVELRLGNSDAALQHYNNALTIALTLVELDPSNSGFQHDLSIYYNKLGNITLRLGNTDAVLEHYNNALAIRLKLVELDPSNSQFQRDLSVSYTKLGDIELRLGNTDAALQHYNNALAVRLKLVELDPSNSEFQRDLSISYSKLGDVELRLGNTDAALEHYNNDLTIALTLVELDPSNSVFQRDTVLSHVNIAEFFQQKDDLLKTSSHYTEAQNILVKMKGAGTLSPDDIWMLDEIAERISALK